MADEIVLLFRDVADLSDAERQEYFDRHRVSASARAEVESLLQFDRPFDRATRSTGRLHEPTLAVRVEAAANQFFEAKAGPGEGDRCGAYELVRMIGRGGMGSVFLARRTDGELEQQAAIKVVRDAAEEPAFRERFLRERQILASLSHPGIAHLLDAGHTSQGQPFLVMEYIEGVPIDVYARDLTLREKLQLFLWVCEAVSYAHRNLVIHRDLKPSNIFVERSGQPKLLDFGIARILDETERSQTRERMLSPDFASPEQVRGTARSTATDIYSLGATLYALLTNRSPHMAEPERGEKRRTSSRETSVEERICSVEPPPPSRWNPSLPRDLDFVLAKSLRKEPEDRYPAVDAFAADIRAVMESRPVQARSANAWYLARKFLRRYWVPAAAAGLVIASLSAGLYIANHERAIAQKRFMEVRQLANKLFDIDAQARELPGSTKTRQFIVDTSLEYLGRLAADVQNDPGLALEVGNAYMRVARVQGVPIGPNLGQLDKAGANLKIADEMMQRVLQAQPGNRTAMLRSAQIAHDRMLLANFQNRDDEALRFAGASAGWLEKFHAVKADGAEDSAILNTYLNVANRYVSAREDEKALVLASRAIELAGVYDFPAYRGTLLWVKTRILQRQGSLDDALAAIHESVVLLDTSGSKVGHGQRSNLATALVYEGRILDDETGIGMGQPERAEKSLQRAFDIVDALVHQDPNNHNDAGALANAAIPLGATLRADPGRALAIFDHALGHLTDVKGDAHLQNHEVRLLVGSSYPLRRLGREAEARKRLDSAFDLLRQLKYYPESHIDPGSETAQAVCALADDDAATGHPERALQAYSGLLDQVAASKPEPETNLTDAAALSKIYTGMAAAARLAKRPAEASGTEARRRELWRRWEQKLPGNPFVLRQVAMIAPPAQ
jgi:tRNA A-37 threonylcarbamoyl transferase component Bud32/tetratricopeptide (TPR) repeat protein